MIKFGTGGWRAIIADEFTKENLQILAEALCRKMKDEHVEKEGIVIGYDRRFLSKESMQWMAEVFAQNNITSRLINRSCPTPVCMFLVQQNHLHYGLMVTASHNPAVYNGVKVFTFGGRDADLTVTGSIENYIAKVQKPVAFMPYEEGIQKGLIQEIYPLDDYIDYILEDIDTKAIRKARLAIAIDPMYGVSETALKTILITARCRVETMHGSHDPLFGGHTPAPDAEAMRELSAYVERNGFDMGIATDGDADRISVVDDYGTFLSANDLLVILYWYLCEYRGMKGPCVRNVCTTTRLDRLAEKFNQKCYEVPVGFKWVSSKMDETHAIIGGESSGGMAIQGRIKGKDGIYAAALLVEMEARTGKKISEIAKLVDEITGTTAFVEHNYRFKAEQKAEFHERIMVNHELPEFPYPVDHVYYPDGCKVVFPDGWISVRFSGTEPLLRVFAEMKTKEEAETVCACFKDMLKLE